MVNYEHILVERDGSLGIVTLNRPQALNALSTPLVSEMADALETLDADPEIRVLILTGGPRAFAAGADLKEMSSQTAVQALEKNRIAYWDRVKKITKPIIAAVSGYALGGGCELAMLCDIIIASETARFGQPEINVGIMPGAGGTQRMTRTVGKFKAMEMILTGAQIDANEAERRGLVNRVVANELLLDEAKRLGLEIAQKPPISVRLAKEAVSKAFESTVEAGIELERRSFYFLFASDDSHEGIQAFLEKRKPEYHGR
jgi:enoyl-CoA hydratase